MLWSSMDRYDKIDGQKAYDLFNELYQKQVLIKVYVDGSDYEHLTLITALEPEAKEPVMRIDLPKGLYAVLQEKQPPLLLGFEFTGRDQLTHKFEARLFNITENEIWLKYPDQVRRYQFRDNFRIKAPRRGAYLTVHVEDQDLRMVIDNISLGGAFCLCANKYKSLIAATPVITRVLLLFTFMDQSLEIQIDRAVQKRMEPVVQPKKFGVAYEFVKIKTEAKRLLTQQIYELQREFLQRRLKAED